jgi:hypothetical protein
VTLIQLLVAVPREQAARYYTGLGASGQYDLTMTSNSREALDLLEDRSRYFDALVVDSTLADAGVLLDELFYRNPRQMVVLVDETNESPLRSVIRPDRISDMPFADDDLERRIARLLSDSRLETVPANMVLPVRELARKLRSEDTPGDRYRVAVAACQGLGYSYTAFYSLERAEPALLRLAAQLGEGDMHLLVPLSAQAGEVIAQVAITGESVVLEADNAADYLPVAVGTLGSVAMVPAGRTACFGVLVAGREAPGAINAQNVAVLELVGAQLAAAIAREMGL